jgi:hypothetical protein
MAVRAASKAASAAAVASAGRACTAAANTGARSARSPGSKMSAGAVASYAAPKTSDSIETITSTMLARSQPASASPEATVSYICRVCGESATGWTAMIGIMAVCWA